MTSPISFIGTWKRSLASYIARALSFPVGAYLYSSGGTTGVNGPTSFTASFWGRLTTLPTTNGEIRTPLMLANSLGRGARFELSYGTTPAITGSMTLTNDVASTRGMNGNFLPMLDGEWHHILMSAVLPSPVINVGCFLYLDDVSVIENSTGDGHASYLDNTDRTIGRYNHPSVFRHWDGDLADIWASTTTFLDLSVEANRRKFITADLRPVDLGELGELPTGSQPRVFVRGPASGVATNRGTLPNWTVNGSITDGSTNP